MWVVYIIPVLVKLATQKSWRGPGSGDDEQIEEMTAIEAAIKIILADIFLLSN